MKSKIQLKLIVDILNREMAKHNIEAKYYTVEIANDRLAENSLLVMGKTRFSEFEVLSDSDLSLIEEGKFNFHHLEEIINYELVQRI